MQFPVCKGSHLPGWKRCRNADEMVMMMLLLLVVVRRRRRKTTTFTWILTTRSRFERCTWCEPRSIITKTGRNRLATPFSTVKASCLFLTAASQHKTLGLPKRKNSISPTASSHARSRLADWPYRHKPCSRPVPYSHCNLNVDVFSVLS